MEKVLDRYPDASCKIVSNMTACIQMCEKIGKYYDIPFLNLSSKQKLLFISKRLNYVITFFKLRNRKMSFKWWLNKENKL